MVITLYKFAKRINSTKQPANTDIYTTYSSAVWIEDTDVIHPSIRIMTAADIDMTLCNYIRVNDPGHIDIDRYYFVDTWRWTNEGWIAECTCDVLATYKTVIGSSYQYIVRSSHSFDGNIIDKFYPAKTDATYTRIVPATTPWLQAVDAGCYIIGVVSPDPQFGAMSYYVLDSNSLKVMCAYLTDQTQTITAANGFDLTDAGLTLQNSILDAFQYIKSCIYVPLSYASITGDSTFASLKIWSFDIPSCPGKTLSQQHPQYTDSRQVTLSKHPQTSARGNWINAGPFTSIEVTFPPFGSFNLDTSITCTNPVIDFDYRTDLITGLTTLWVYAKATVNATDRILIATREGQIGIPIQLAQVNRDYIGGAKSVLGSIAAGLVGTAVAGPIGLALAGGGVVGSITDMIVPHSQTIGSAGAWYQLIAPCSVYMTFYPAVEDDNSRFGRPLVGKGTISSYPGYLLCQDVNFAITGALMVEYSMIKDYMESGFFYE